MDDEKIYNAILDELHANGPRQGLWAKCFAEANGNENAAKALYFKYRAQQLADQESSATAKSNSTDLAKHVVSNEQSTSHTSQNNTVVLLLLALAIAFCVGWWLFSFREKQDVIAAPVNPFTANSSQITAPNSEKQQVEKNASQSAFTEKNQTSEDKDTLKAKAKINEYEIAGKAIEKELASNLHLFKYRIKSGKIIFYSKDEINFYPIDYKYSNELHDDTRLVAEKEFIGDPNKNQPNIVLYSLQGSQGNVPPIDYCYRSRDFHTSDYIRCFYSLDPRQDPKIRLTENRIELSYVGYSKDDSRAGPSIPVIKIFEYINNNMICTMGNCEFKDFNHRAHFIEKFSKIK